VTQLPTTPYLDRPRPRKIGDKYVGGTVIAAHVVTLAQHEAALANPDLVRPRECAACKWPTLHVHERRSRKLDGLGSASTDILIFRCARCQVVWRVLPALLARHLWRTWDAISIALDKGHNRSTTPMRTLLRWLQRLCEHARMLIVVLGQWGPACPRAVAELGVDATRRHVIEAYGGFGRLADLAQIVDHLVPGVRVM
jgi:hypothetical protein